MRVIMNPWQWGGLGPLGLLCHGKKKKSNIKWNKVSNCSFSNFLCPVPLSWGHITAPYDLLIQRLRLEVQAIWYVWYFFGGGTRSRLTTWILKISKSGIKHVKWLHQLWTSYNSNMQLWSMYRAETCSCILYIATDYNNFRVSWLYVYIDIYTLQLCIIDLTQRGCHTLRLEVEGLDFWDVTEYCWVSSCGHLEEL